MESYELYVIDKHQFYCLRLVVAPVEKDESSNILDVMIAVFHNSQLRLS